jgi:hypothetical protein
MATPAHCAYCFESLSARLERRKQLSLTQVEELWDLYDNGEEDEAAAQLKAGSGQVNGIEEDEQMEDKSTAEEPSKSPYKPAAISRLLNSSPSSSSSSSKSPSAASSTPSLDSTASQSSSRTSLFSLPKPFGRGRKGATNRSSDDDEYPLFVTWNKVNSRGHKLLAGCIGTFEPYPLEEGLNSYAITSYDNPHDIHLPSMIC